MPGSTRHSIPKMYEACRTCEYNISSYGKCKKSFDNFYFRKGKDNGCERCSSETRIRKGRIRNAK